MPPSLFKYCQLKEKLEKIGNARYSLSTSMEQQILESNSRRVDACANLHFKDIIGIILKKTNIQINTHNF